MAGIGIRRTVRVCLAAIAMSGMAACRLSIDDVPAEEPMVSRPVFTDFSLGNYSGTKKSLSTEIGDGNVVVIYPYGENVDILKATFATDAVEVTVNGINQVSGTTSNDFSRPVRYRLVSEDGIVSEYIVSVRFASDVPVLYITTPGKAAINSKVDWIAGGEIDICNLDGKVDSLGALSVRGRGNSTWSYPKKSYNIKLDSRQEVLGMNRHKRWCLLANWMDRTMLRNAVAFEIAKRTKGLAWTPDGQFVDLVLNGKHCGAYYLCEHIRIDKNRVDIAEMTSADIAGENLTGGYLLELDSYYDEINKF
ncbi:MAG: CotH kinase family protein, partial [Clostridium sp.]|nr:CotH kinase family protein [Clostridium sp.]